MSLIHEKEEDYDLARMIKVIFINIRFAIQAVIRNLQHTNKQYIKVAKIIVPVKSMLLRYYVKKLIGAGII